MQVSKTRWLLGIMAKFTHEHSHLQLSNCTSITMSLLLHTKSAFV